MYRFDKPEIISDLLQHVISDELDNNLVGDGFTLSRLLGGGSGSPSASSWDTINDNLSAAGQPTPPSNASYENPSSVPSSNYDNAEYQGQQGANTGANNPGYRPWEAEQQQQQQQQQQHGAATTATSVAAAPPPVYYSSHYGQHPHLPSFQSQFHFSDTVPPPNTQAPAGPPVPTTGQ